MIARVRYLDKGLFNTTFYVYSSYQFFYNIFFLGKRDIFCRFFFPFFFLGRLSTQCLRSLLECLSSEMVVGVLLYFVSTQGFTRRPYQEETSFRCRNFKESQLPILRSDCHKCQVVEIAYIGKA